LQVVIDPAKSHYDRGQAAESLRLGGNPQGVRTLIDEFLRETERDKIYVAALALEQTYSRRVETLMLRTLRRDPNPHRREGAARTLGWMPLPRADRVNRALAACLGDRKQPPEVRTEAAESLKYGESTVGTEALIEALQHPEVSVRFFAVFALGPRLKIPGVIEALTGKLDDEDELQGYWSVGLEALAMLSTSEGAPEEFLERAQNEARRIFASAPRISKKDPQRYQKLTPEFRWAEGYFDGFDASA
jgi:HEAT repeat protein